MVGLVDRTRVMTSGRLARSKVMSDGNVMSDGTVGTVAALESAWRDVFVQLRPADVDSWLYSMAELVPPIHAIDPGGE